MPGTWQALHQVLIAGQGAWPLSIYLGWHRAPNGSRTPGPPPSLRLDAEDLIPPPHPQRVSKAQVLGGQTGHTDSREIQLLFIDMESRYPQLPEDEVGRRASSSHLSWVLLQGDGPVEDELEEEGKNDHQTSYRYPTPSPRGAEGQEPRGSVT